MRSCMQFSGILGISKKSSKPVFWFKDFRLLLTGLGFVLSPLKFVKAYYEKAKLDHIATLGPDRLWGSYMAALRWTTAATDIVEEGYHLYPGGIYKIPTIDGWRVVVNGTGLVKDIMQASDEQLQVVTNEILQTRYTMHPELAPDPCYIDVIRTPLTRNIGARFADVHDAVRKVISENIPITDDWTEMYTYQTVLAIVFRAVNCLFAGLPLFWDPDWYDLNITFAIDVVVNSAIINLFPKFTHPVVGRIFTGRKSAMRRAIRHLQPIIQERLKMQEQIGQEWVDRPSDFIQWLIDTEQNAPLSQRTSVEDICIRVLAANFAAVHTTSFAFTCALYHLASHPELAEPLRKEVQMTVEREGWTKVSMVQMRLLDNFLKESERLNGVGATGLQRKVLQDFTFSNGITVPAGTMIGASTWGLQRDDEIYPKGDELNHYRFYEMPSREGERSKHQLVIPPSEWLTFGQGGHACPGRFFASAELKVMMAHILLNYDVKFPNDSKGFPRFKFSNIVGPNQTAKVLFRKRKVD
ncbi:cytochrome P450 [Dendrothele bispora CBS 962.96]|uniref:Cytochrome P450 n=1 Tax=Dendrothele bispora (strain CBS 962.96) TaxID=1314807 RepID=A0A4S8MWM3_DENBC|nr:cytochrome P450 [Dendrothele bispora CBS 962.96]